MDRPVIARAASGKSFFLALSAIARRQAPRMQAEAPLMVARVTTSTVLINSFYTVTDF